MRVYNPAIETVPRFDTTVYRYFGRAGERAPKGATHIIIDPSVKTIKYQAFSGYDTVKCCQIHGGVEKIEKSAFSSCTSLEALFLPSSVTEIEERAFDRCRNLRILSLPHDINVDKIGLNILYECHTFFQTTHIQQYTGEYYHQINNKDQVHQAVINFYRNQSPLHKVCLNTNVSAQAIEECIQTHGKHTLHITDHDGMTPLHILAINPHADTLAIFAYFKANMNAVFVSDGRNKTPLDYLEEYNVEGYLYLIRDLCVHREAHMEVEDGASLPRKTESNTYTCSRKRKLGERLSVPIL